MEGFQKKESGIDVLLTKAPTLHADMAILAIGVTPDTSLAKEAGLLLGMKGSIVVNDHMETSIPDIYAVGDAIQIKHSVTGEDALISLAGPANKQGRIAADNICGGDSRYQGSQGSSVLKIFDMTAAVTGLNETNAIITTNKTPIITEDTISNVFVVFFFCSVSLFGSILYCFLATTKLHRLTIKKTIAAIGIK